MSRQFATVSLKVGMDQIRAYADLTDDHNPIHLDPDFAATTPMNGVIAHGTMSICLLWQAIFRNLSSADVEAAVLDVKFVKPVRVGEMLTAGGEAEASDPNLYRVWVRAEDGIERLAGTLALADSRTRSNEETTTWACTDDRLDDNKTRRERLDGERS